MTGRHSQLILTQLNIAGIILRKESECSNWALSGTFRLPSEKSGKGLPLGYIWRLVKSMRRRCDAVFRTNGGHTCYWTSKCVTENAEYDTVKILSICLLWNFCVSVPLIWWNIIVFKVELLIFRQKPQQSDRKWHQSQACGAFIFYLAFVRHHTYT